MIVGARCGRNPVRYWWELILDSYHRERGQAALTVHREFARMIGVTSDLTEQAFRNIFDGFNADRSKKLVHSTHNRHPGLDIVLAPAKWFSALYALAPPALRKELEQLFTEAVHATMQVFAQDMAMTRRGAGGKFEDHAKDILYFLAVHPAGRKGQVHLHAHVLLPNVCLRQDGSTGTLELTRFFENRRTLDTVFTEELACRLRAKLGLELRPAKHGHELVVDKGIEPQFRALLAKWSPGTRGIDELLEQKGLPRTAKTADFAQMKLRGKKEVVPYEQLFTRWRDEARSFGITYEKLIPERGPDLGSAQEPPPEPLDEQERERLPEVFAWIADQLTATKNHFSEQAFIAYTVRLAHGIAARSYEVTFAAREFLHRSEHIVRLGENAHAQPFFTTARRWREEQRLLDLARKIEEATVTAFHPATAAKAARGAERRAGTTLDESGREALYRIATSESRIHALDTGRSGGADTLIRAIARLARKHNFQVVAAATTAHEAAEFQRRTGIRAQTVNQWFLQYGRQSWKPPRHTLRRLKEALFGKRLRPEVMVKRLLERSVKAATEALLGVPGRLQLSSQTLLVTVGTQRLSVADLTKLLELSALSGGRALLVGDTSGLPALAHAGGFAGLTEVIPTARLAAPSAAKSAWLRGAQDAFSAGAYEHAFARFAKAGRLFLGNNSEQALRQLIRDWSTEGVNHPKRNLILTNSEAERRTANHLAQRARWKALRIAPLHFLTSSGSRIHQSDRVVLRHGFTVHGIFLTRRVKAGELATVLHIDVLRSLITLKTDRGVRVTFDKKRFPDFIDLGYALTTSRAEALRASRVHALIGPGAHEALRAKVFAGERETFLYTTRRIAGDPIAALARVAERRDGTQLAVSLDREHQRLEQVRHEQQHTHRHNR